MPRIAIESNSVSAIIEIVRLGRHVTILPSSIARAQPGLTPVTLSPGLPKHSVTLISHRGAYKSQACRAFGNLAADFAASCSNRPTGKPTRAASDSAKGLALTPQKV